MALTGNVAESWPTGMTTDDGTVASVVSLLDKLTVSGWARSNPMRVTVAVAAPGPEYSFSDDGAIASVNEASGTVRSSRRSRLRSRRVIRRREREAWGESIVRVPSAGRETGGAFRELFCQLFRYT